LTNISSVKLPLYVEKARWHLQYKSFGFSAKDDITQNHNQVRSMIDLTPNELL